MVFSTDSSHPQDDGANLITSVGQPAENPDEHDVDLPLPDVPVIKRFSPIGGMAMSVPPQRSQPDMMPRQPL